MTRRVKAIPIVGGENLVTSSLAIEPGELLFSQNYEIDDGGHPRRIDGYERFDGHPSPSSAAYWVLPFDAGAGLIEVGDIVEGGTSGATGEVLVVAVESGAWGIDAAGYLILFNVSGAFVDDEPIEVSAATQATAAGAATENGADNDADDATWTQAAIEARRADISAVPGVGSILGVHHYNSHIYAFRAYGAGTLAKMYTSSASGWEEFDLGGEIIFTTGTTVAPSGGVVGATSGATALVSVVTDVTGDWGVGTAAGYIHIYSIVGTFQMGETINWTGGSAVVDVAAENTLRADSMFRCITANFAGSAFGAVMVCANSLDRAFVVGLGGIAFIRTFDLGDIHVNVFEHKNHLFIDFGDGTFGHSAIGDPFDWEIVSGAGLIGVGDFITGFATIPGDTLAIFSRNSTNILYGSSSADFEMKLHSKSGGAIEGTIQEIGSPKYLDDRGLTSIEATQEYGDFKAATFSTKIQPLIDAKKDSITCSTRSRTKNQYRLFFSDSTGITCTFVGGRKPMFSRQRYGTVVACVTSSEVYREYTSYGVVVDERIFFGSDDGYVYEMDAGTSFDGSTITSYLRLPFAHFGMPQQKKRVYKVVMELDTPAECDLSFAYDFNYGSADIPTGSSIPVQGGGGFWGISEWGEFMWGSQVVGTAEGYVSGTGINFGIVIKSESIYDQPHTIKSALIHYSVRGLAR